MTKEEALKLLESGDADTRRKPSKKPSDKDHLNTTSTKETLLTTSFPESVTGVAANKEKSFSNQSLDDIPVSPDSLNFSQEDDLIKPLSNTGQFERMTFLNDANELIAFLYEDARTGDKKNHLWQIEINEKIAQHPISTKKPLKVCVCAANGSGKDDRIIAANAVFLSLRYIKTNTVITSASGVQLTNQTEQYIRLLCAKINEKFGMPYFKINQRNIQCRFSGSVIRMFATDEPGKAEGYHPIPEGDGVCFIVLNEVKSIPEAIVDATKRCTPTHLLYISSPGEPKGAFYRAFTSWTNVYRVTTMDCPHKSQEEMEADRLDMGEHSALFRSKHLALFTAVDGQCCISEDAIDLCRKTVKEKTNQDWAVRIGLDSAAGGDETAVVGWRGNYCIQEKWFREKDTTVAVDKIEAILLSTPGVDKAITIIYADDGGVSKAITDGLARRGWIIRRMLNQWAARNKRDFGNIGAENWFRLGRLISQKLLILSNLSEKTISQLKSRHYRKGEKDRTYLKKKSEEKAEGFDSPDRADAHVLALCDLTLEDFLGETNSRDYKPKHLVDIDTLVKEQMDSKYKGINDSIKGSANGHIIPNSHWQESQFEVVMNQSFNSKTSKLVRGSLSAALQLN